MENNLPLRAAVRTLPVYEPGRPIELVAREYGLDPARVIKLASNENALGPSPRAVAAARAALAEIHLYPENSGFFLKEKLSARLAWPAAQIILGAGSNELFYLLASAFLEPGTEAVMGAQAFVTYRIATLLHGATPVVVPMPDFRHDLAALRAAVTPRTRVVFLPNPNNPTGTVLAAAEVLAFARDLPPEVVLCYDEAYVEYGDDAPDFRPLLAEGRPILCARTFSKIYGLAGLRIGYGFGPAALISALERIRPPFNVGSDAQAAALAALDDDDHVRRSRENNRAGLLQLTEGLGQLGYRTVPSAGNFLLVEVGEAAAVNQALLRRGLIVRPVAGYGLPRHLRITVGTPAQNQALLDALRAAAAAGEFGRPA